jgi:RNA polymerase sigma-70 factor (ECF subfamily)
MAVKELIRARTEAVYKEESRRVLATLIRLLGDFDLAEEALQEAFRAALEQWPRDGMPNHPRAWLVSTGRFKAIDRLRREQRFEPLTDLSETFNAGVDAEDILETQWLEDDRLRLIFTCCHPALSHEAQVALTLRAVCDLTTEEIAAAFLTRPSTLAQRIVRAKAKIRDARIPYEIPGSEDLHARLDAVLQVIYLIFNEGYSASIGEAHTRADLSGEAIRLGRLLVELMPDPETVGLLALMLLQESRREARTTPDGDLILLQDQDRSRWNRQQIDEGITLVEQALSSRRVGPYSLQAAIAAAHATAASAEATDWPQIVALYDILMLMANSPVVELNRAVAVAMRDGPEAGLALVEAIQERGELVDYHLMHAARADLYRRLDRVAEAQQAYERALSLAQQAPERRFLERRLAQLKTQTIG